MIALLALAGIAAMHTTVPDQAGWFDRVLVLALASAPALLLAYVIGGFLYGELPEPVLRWLIALFVSLPLLGVEMTVIRVAGAALLVLLVVASKTSKGTLPIESASKGTLPIEGASKGTLPIEGRGASPLRGSAGMRWRAALRAGVVDLVDGTAPWIVLGIAIAAAAEPFLTQMPWAQWPDSVEVVLFALLGMPLYICAAGITPLIAVLLAAGVSPGAALAFLLTGPATLGMLRRLHGSALAWRFAVVAAAGAVAMGLAVNLLPAPSLPVLDHAAEQSSWLQQLSLVLLALLYAGSLLRRGARASLSELYEG